MNTATNPNSRWLFPGRRAGQPMHPESLAALVNKLGVPTSTGRTAAIHQHVLSDHLGQRFVLKPLGPGNFEDDHGNQQVVFVREIEAAGLGAVDLLDAPFLAQRAVRGRCHLRVVTVGERAWIAELDATGLPLDWRANRPGTVFSCLVPVRRGGTRRRDVGHDAAGGFTSQDWIVDDAGPAFLDLNPGGQWLFLPHEVSAPATAALADWLRDGA